MITKLDFIFATVVFGRCIIIMQCAFMITCAVYRRCTLHSLTQFIQVDTAVSVTLFRVNVGFIGGGRLCRHIVDAITANSGCYFHDIIVATFHPEKCSDLIKKGTYEYLFFCICRYRELFFIFDIKIDHLY